MEKEGYGYNKHETFDALMACFEKAASEYDLTTPLAFDLALVLLFICACA